MLPGIRPIKTQVLQFEDAAGNKYDDIGWHHHVYEELTRDRSTPPGWPSR